MTSSLFIITAFLTIFLAGGVWVTLALMGTGIFTLEILRDIPVHKLLAIVTWNSTTSPELLALPLFVLMAEVLFRTNISESLFRGLAPWASNLPGRLLHVNVVGCTLFAAVSGSSAATTATVGRITLPELLGRGYDRSLVIGSLAGAGTLGLLIPPSLIMIVYGVMAEVSILKLFIAGVIPGLLLATCFALYIAIIASVKDVRSKKDKMTYTWRDRMWGLFHLGPVAFLIGVIIVSMYGGIATPTEAASLGLLGALVIAAIQKTLSWANLKVSLLESVRTVSMIGMILVGAQLLTVALDYFNVPMQVANYIGQLGLSRLQLMILLIVFYIALGALLDGTSMIVMTLPVVLPLVKSAGYDPIWFGVFLVLMVEMAQISPPVGFNLFVIQNITQDTMWDVTRYTLPFFLIMIAFTFVIIFYPGIVLWLT
jgi:tripartite ATP-independent transporter DctM subunit